jgi:hypothetical protein
VILEGGFEGGKRGELEKGVSIVFMLEACAKR